MDSKIKFALLMAVLLSSAALAAITIEIKQDGTVRIQVDGDSNVIVEQPAAKPAPSEPDPDDGGELTWPVNTVLAREGGNGISYVNTHSGRALNLADTLIRGGKIGFNVWHTPGSIKRPMVESLTVRDCKFEKQTEHGMYAAGVKRIVIEGLIVVGEPPNDAFDHGIYIGNTYGEGADCEVVIRNSAFIRAPGYGVKVRSDYKHGFAKVTIENCLFVDCPEPVGLRPNTTGGGEPDEPIREVVIRDNVFVHTPDFEYPDGWKGRKLVRLYQAGELTFTGNISMGTEARADKPRDAIAHAKWPAKTVIENNAHRDVRINVKLPATPEGIQPLLEELQR